MNRTPLVLAVSFPLLGWIRDFHPLETCAARRTRIRSSLLNGVDFYFLLLFHNFRKKSTLELIIFSSDFSAFLYCTILPLFSSVLSIVLHFICSILRAQSNGDRLTRLLKHIPACLPVFLHRRYKHMKKPILVVMAAAMGD